MPEHTRRRTEKEAERISEEKNVQNFQILWKKRIYTSKKLNKHKSSQRNAVVKLWNAKHQHSLDSFKKLQVTRDPH
jgi:hypothetical protein